MKKNISLLIFLTFLSACTPASTPVPTPTFLPAPIATSTIMSTPSPTPIPWQKYRMTYLVKEVGYGKLWMPVPRNWEGVGMQNVEIIKILPLPADQYQDIQGNQIVFWNRNGAQEYRIMFDIELSEIHYDIDADNIGSYNINDPDYTRYTSPSSRVESDDPRLLELAQSIVGDEENPYYQAGLIHSWVSRNIDNHGEDGETALSTLKKMSGACGGHSFLYIALLRSLGIPARNIGGIRSGGLTEFPTGNFKNESLRIHVWTEIYFPNYGWIQSDSSAGNKVFIGIDELRIILFRGEDIELGYGYPLEIIPWFHMPQKDFIGNSDPATQTIGEYLGLEVERINE